MCSMFSFDLKICNSFCWMTFSLQIEAVYYFVVGDIPECAKHLLTQKISRGPCPIHTISFNAREEETVAFLKDLSQLTTGRYEVNGISNNVSSIYPYDNRSFCSCLHWCFLARLDHILYVILGWWSLTYIHVGEIWTMQILGVSLISPISVTKLKSHIYCLKRTQIASNWLSPYTALS